MQQGLLEKEDKTFGSSKDTLKSLEKGNSLERGKTFKATASSKATLKKVKQGSPLKKGSGWGDGQTMVAVDAAGFPKMLASPKAAASPPRLWKQKKGGCQKPG